MSFVSAWYEWDRLGNDVAVCHVKSFRSGKLIWPPTVDVFKWSEVKEHVDSPLLTELNRKVLCYSPK